MGPIGCPETSARNYRYSQHNSPEERSSQDLTCLEFDGLPGCSSKQETVQNITHIDNINVLKIVFIVNYKPYVIYAYEVGDHHIIIYFYGLFCDRVA